MNKTGIIAFIFGAAIGSVVTWKLVKTTYEQRAREEIAEMREWVDEKTKDLGVTYDAANGKVARVTSIKDEMTMNEYASIVNNEGYTNYSDSKSEEKEEVEEMTSPYVISPDEYGEKDDYDMVSLSYYADGILADENDELIEDIEGTVGKDFASHFGEYEDDSVFIRNDDISTDYEILRDLRNYSNLYSVNN